MRPQDLWAAVAAAGAFLALAAVGNVQHPGFPEVYRLVAAAALLVVSLRRLRHIDRHWWEY